MLVEKTQQLVGDTVKYHVLATSFLVDIVCAFGSTASGGI